MGKYKIAAGDIKDYTDGIHADGAQAIFRAVMSGKDRAVLKELVGRENNISRALGRRNSVDAGCFTFEPKEGGSRVGGGHRLGRKEDCEEGVNNSTEMTFSVKFKEMVDGSKWYEEVIEIFPKHLTTHFVRAVYEQNANVLQPNALAMIPEIFWSLIYHFRRIDEGVETVQDIYLKLFPQLDWDFLNVKRKSKYRK